MNRQSPVYLWTPQPHRGHKCGLEEQAAACQSHLAQLWAYFSVPCSLLHVESSVEQWCLQRTCFLILHLVIFFLYFCWFNICINCKYIWFITVKPLVPVSGLPPWLFLINTLDLGFESKVHAHVGKFSVLFSLHTHIWHGRLLCWDWSCQVCGSPETKDQNWNYQWMTALIEEIEITLILILWDLWLKLTNYYHDFYFVFSMGSYFISQAHFELVAILLPQLGLQVCATFPGLF